MKLQIVKTGINGEGIGYDDNHKPVFVPGVLQDEVCDIEITQRNKGYSFARVNKVIKKSKRRVNSQCEYQFNCGSCPLMITDYNNQLNIKYDLLKEALNKYAGYKGKIEKTVGCQEVLYYRNKVNLPIVEKNGKLYNAMYAARSNNPIIINECCLHQKDVEETRIRILDILNKYHFKSYDNKQKKGLRQLIIRKIGEIQVLLIGGNDEIPQEMINEILSIKDVVSFYYGVNTAKNPVNMVPDKISLVGGKKSITADFGGYKICLQPQSFFQLNTNQAEVLYQTVSNLIDEKVSLIVEAYCGVGTISMYLHDRADKVIGVEIIPSAVKDAKANATSNKITNCQFVCGDAGQQIAQIAKKQKIDIMVVDPPRSGLDETMIETIIHSKPQRVIYVSCNPATLAKNINDLKDKYSVMKVIPVDMFPQTEHIESVCLLQRN